jgi:hypothetical protein
MVVEVASLVRSVGHQGDRRHRLSPDMPREYREYDIFAAQLRGLLNIGRVIETVINERVWNVTRRRGARGVLIRKRTSKFSQDMRYITPRISIGSKLAARPWNCHNKCHLSPGNCLQGSLIIDHQGNC